MSTKVFETDWVICEVDDSIPLLRHRWIRKPSSKEFRSGLKAVLTEYNQLSSKYKDLKWLADTEMLGELSTEDEKWLTNEWDDMLFREAGVKVHAVILGHDIFADYPMEDFKMSSARKFTELGVKLEVFTDEESAYEWLRSH